MEFEASIQQFEGKSYHFGQALQFILVDFLEHDSTTYASLSFVLIFINCDDAMFRFAILDLFLFLTYYYSSSSSSFS